MTDCSEGPQLTHLARHAQKLTGYNMYIIIPKMVKYNHKQIVISMKGLTWNQSAH